MWRQQIVNLSNFSYYNRWVITTATTESMFVDCELPSTSSRTNEEKKFPFNRMRRRNLLLAEHWKRIRGTNISMYKWGCKHSFRIFFFFSTYHHRKLVNSFIQGYRVSKMFFFSSPIFTWMRIFDDKIHKMTPHTKYESMAV